jgi:transcriptional regulator with XRE-family HTH domain
MKRVVPTPFPASPLVSDARAFGAAIRAARTGAGMTLEEAAAAIGISKQTMLDVETAGDTVSFGIVLKVARELGVSVFVAAPGQRELVRRAIAGDAAAAAGAAVGASIASAAARTSRAKPRGRRP